MPQLPQQPEQPRPSSGEPRFLEQVAQACRLKRIAYRTEQSYVAWVKRFLLCHNKRHPREMGPTEVRAFLTHLAVNRRVSALTQNQALNAIVFIYRDVVRLDPCEFGAFERAKRSFGRGDGAFPSRALIPNTQVTLPKGENHLRTPRRLDGQQHDAEGVAESSRGSSAFGGPKADADPRKSVKIAYRTQDGCQNPSTEFGRQHFRRSVTPPG
jgi:Phage integrase, N-terminal SAM-like domain